MVIGASVGADDATTMQHVADAFSAAIAEHPVDWHMMQRVFVA